VGFPRRVTKEGRRSAPQIHVKSNLAALGSYRPSLFSLKELQQDLLLLDQLFQNNTFSSTNVRNYCSWSILTIRFHFSTSCTSRSSLSEMPAAATTGSHPSSFKMEDRKRSLAPDDYAPPTKRQAVNGNRSSANDDLPWKDDLEVCQVTRHLNTFHQYTNHISSPFSWVCDISGFYAL
jgi:hypothetical protein